MAIATNQLFGAGAVVGGKMTTVSRSTPMA